MATINDFAKRPDVEFTHINDESVKFRFVKIVSLSTQKFYKLQRQFKLNPPCGWQDVNITAEMLLTDGYYEEIKQPVVIKRWLVVILEPRGEIDIIKVCCDKKHAEYKCNEYFEEGYKCEVVPFTHTFKG